MRKRICQPVMWIFEARHPAQCQWWLQPVVHWTSQMFYRRVMTSVHDPVRLSLRLYWTCALIFSLIFNSSCQSPCITPMQGLTSSTVLFWTENSCYCLMSEDNTTLLAYAARYCVYINSLKWLFILDYLSSKLHWHHCVENKWNGLLKNHLCLKCSRGGRSRAFLSAKDTGCSLRCAMRWFGQNSYSSYLKLQDWWCKRDTNWPTVFTPLYSRVIYTVSSCFE